jgi:hypothetical protein
MAAVEEGVLPGLPVESGNLSVQLCYNSPCLFPPDVHSRQCWSCRLMLAVVRKLSLGGGLVICCSALLVGWDYLDHQARRKIPRIAILQQSSTPVLDDCVTGMIDGLEASGYKNGSTLVLELYNAENDSSTGKLPMAASILL